MPARTAGAAPVVRAATLALCGLLAAACPVAAAQDRAADDALAVLARVKVDTFAWNRPSPVEES